MALVKLIGETVIGKDGTKVEVSTLAGEGKVLGLYFSAHWCPPCRAFTPQLGDFYKNVKDSANGPNFEIVFVSSDRDEQSFKDYFGEMPWHALEWGSRDKKTTLSKKYKVEGIPTLVLLDADKGTVLSKDGRNVVLEDPEGKDFPWMPKPFSEIIKGKLIGKEGAELQWEDCAGKVIGLYFSAHWCGPCRFFTPELVKTYEKMKEDGKNFEFIFISSDRDEESFKSYYDTMPWLALPFKEPGDSRKKELSQTFSVNGIPTLIILDENGKEITSNGRREAAADTEGADFPWYPKPVNELTGSTAPELNEFPCLVLFTDGDEGKMANAKALLKPVAEKYFADCKSQEKKQELRFFFASQVEDDGVVESLREFAGLPVKNPLMAITDIPQQQVFISDKAPDTQEIVSDFLQGYLNSSLTGKALH